MSGLKSKSRNLRIYSLSLLLLLLLATMLTVGAAFAGLPADNPSSPPAQSNMSVQGTPTPTATCTAAGTPGPWSARANYPHDYAFIAVGSDGTNVYTFGGRNFGGPFGAAYKYTYTTDTWTPIASGGAVAWANAEYGDNGKFYVIGGSPSVWNVNRIYDIATNSWSQGAPVPTASYVSHYASAYWNGKVYLIGGYGPTNAVYAYDIATNSWSTLAPLPQAEQDMVAEAINGRIYVANGQTSGGARLNNLYIYDIAANTWSEGPPSPLAFYSPGSTVIGGKLYMIGGNAPPNGYTSNTYLYDPGTEDWSAGLNLNVARGGGNAATINTPGGQTAIVVGGFGSPYWLNSVEASTAPLLSCTPTVTGTPPTNTPTRTRTPTRTSTPTPDPCALAWRVVPGPSQGDTLHSVAVVAPNDIWAVGVYYPPDAPDNYAHTLVEHWDGSQWSIVPSPSPGVSFLYGIAAISANNIWAVGNYDGGSLIEHWDGSQWSIVPSPNQSGNEYLYDVAAVSANDVWAVGTNYVSNQSAQTLIEHWDGVQWSIVPSPNPGTGLNILSGVEAVAANDVWAVGQYGGTWRTLIEHWNGSQWSIVPSPNPGNEGVLQDVTAVAPNDVWAVGYGGGYPDYQTLTEHWDGSQWSIVPSPNEGTGGNFLYGVDELASNDVWAVGWNGDGTMTQHWDGSQWSIAPDPSSGMPRGYLYGVAVASGNDVWAVGVYYPTGSSQQLIERYNAPCAGATVTPTNIPTLTPTPINTPILTSTRTPAPINTWVPPSSTVPSNTIVPPTNTAVPSQTTSTPTTCTTTFTDVPSSSTFYPNIRCMACRGIISGYSDGTFRPNNEVTRGQLAKIVSNAAGYREEVAGQTFEDAPPDSTFYIWIERLAQRGLMQGYPCGGPGEPCIPGNRPYFRPGANATRGQTAKIVANAAGFANPCQGQAFEDVPPGHTFYCYIQRLAVRDIMQGYPCGSPGEPCMSGKPYFRPGNNVTRGQSAKIVANTFFPNCITP